MDDLAWTVIAVTVIFILIFGWLCATAPEETAPPEETAAKPPCFGSDPSPQDRAEKDCLTCTSMWGCIAQANYTRQQRARDAERQSPEDPFIPVSMRHRD